MNIFYTDADPYQCAINLGDKHVVKMVLETAQLLCTSQRMHGNTDEALYKSAYVNHPCTVWTRDSNSHYAWLYEHFLALLDEYEHRYYRDHACSKLVDVLGEPLPINNGWRQPPQCMPFKYNVDGDSVLAYRKYYINDKKRMHWWTNRQQPEWIT